MLIYYYLALSLLTFLVWGYDKLQAQTGGWRVPERTLQILVLVGGAFGALAGMQLFRHKRRKPAFRALVAAGCVLHAVIFLLTA